MIINVLSYFWGLFMKDNEQKTFFTQKMYILFTHFFSQFVYLSLFI